MTDALTRDAGDDRLASGARPVMEAVAAVFPDLGGEVTDAAEARRLFAENSRSPLEAPEVSGVTDRSIPGPEGAPDLPVRIYRPFGEGPHPTVVYLHGGGWVFGSLESHDSAVRGLCREAGAVVVSVDYRLSPETRFPGAVEDAYAAVRWASDHIGELGGAPGALVVAGDSAGGNMAAVAALAARDRGGPRIALQVLIYPVTDFTREYPSHRRNGEGYVLTGRSMRWLGLQYIAPGTDLADPYLSPMCGDPAGLPPAHVVTGGCDPLCDEGRAYAQKLREAGIAVEEGHYPGMFHGFFGFEKILPDAADALQGIAKAVAETASDGKNIG